MNTVLAPEEPTFQGDTPKSQLSEGLIAATINIVKGK